MHYSTGIYNHLLVKYDIKTTEHFYILKYMSLYMYFASNVSYGYYYLPSIYIFTWLIFQIFTFIGRKVINMVIYLH